MAEPLKNSYNTAFFKEFTGVLQQYIPQFNQKSFLKDIYADGWEEKELKQRMRHISTTLHRYLPEDYPKAVTLILKVVAELRRIQDGMSWTYMLIPDYIEQYGLEDLITSIRAMEEITQLTSCEFAVRPFILRYHNSTSSTLIRLEYGLYFQKANGSLSRKVFKISEKVYAAQSKTTIHRKQPFRIITTRKLHPGLHQVSLILNGKEMGKKDFELVS